ncbi:ZIP family metal transporter [Paenibacillus sp. y28]
MSSISTGLGALPVLLLRNLSHRWRDFLLAFTAGIMVAASTYGLIPSALKLSNLMVLCIGIIAGTCFLTLLEKLLPHVDLSHSPHAGTLDASALLFLSAITLHNIPEGLSVGISYASQQPELGVVVAFAIGLQNAPEGFLVAFFLICQRIAPLKAVAFAAITGVIELAAALIGYELTGSIHGLVPYGLSFAAGAMLFIVYKELIPESHGHGYERSATFAFILGLLAMIGLVDAFR